MKKTDETRAVVTVSEMARMVGLSRARFYQLLEAGVFPPPERDSETGRPFYTEELQQLCREVRWRNMGVNGRPILFYTRRRSRKSDPAKSRTTRTLQTQNEPHTDLLDGLMALGLISVTAAQVRAAVGDLFPSGTAGMEPAEVLRGVFLHLRRQSPSQ